MADGTSAPIKVRTFSAEDAQKLHAKLLAMLSLAEVIQAAATGDMELDESGIYGTASLLEQQANDAIAILGV